MRRALLLPLVLPLLVPAAAHAQQADLVDLIRNDLTALGVNTPVFLAQHLPATMPVAGIGAGLGLSDDSGGFSFGILTRVGLFNNFNEVGYGLELADVRGALPELLPWPQLGLTLGVGLGDGVELGADVQFIPEMDIAGDDISLKAGLFSGAATLRWRVNKADGALPALILGVGAAYYQGSFELGAGYTEPYTETVDGQVVTGSYTFQTAPAVSWSLFQLSPEVRLAWDIAGVLRPYLGFGLGLTIGTVDDRLGVKARLSVDTVDGQPVDREDAVLDENVVRFETEPAFYVLRPHVGIDLVLGVIAITAQLDFAVMGQDEIDSDFESAAGSFDINDPNFLYNEAAGGAQSNAALVFTVAARAQF